MEPIAQQSNPRHYTDLLGESLMVLKHLFYVNNIISDHNLSYKFTKVNSKSCRNLGKLYCFVLTEDRFCPYMCV